ncbi:hypothetical protein N9A15_05785, partial [Candidatus Pelagibacter sp.]|nr:hypothetical protein [Candidatus Pelagibacter sp.]
TELSKNTDFFLPLVGLEKTENSLESEADIKAAEKMGKLYDILINDNKDILSNKENRHNLNIFFTRLLFCFFAEDSYIFDKGLFTQSVASHTEENGHDLNIYLEKLFKILNTKERINCPKYLSNFPYVNGGLFLKEYKIPIFSKESRKILIQSGELDWSSINPDILGSMMQAVVHNGQRKELGMHYTSVKNIIKVIKPLFLDELYKDLGEAEDDVKKLKKILINIYDFRFIDPACGSGNFLVIAYKEICKVEIEIYKKLKKLDKNNWLILRSGILLTQFYGIEKDDYACEAAKLSLWIAQHQMNQFFKEVLGEEKPTLPLSPSGNIYCDNAARIDWDLILAKDIDKNCKIFLFGNPPYGGHEKRSKEQQIDFEFSPELSPKLDYISIWFLKASKFIINKNASIAFVTTKSICLGEQVEKMWAHLLDLKVTINFAYKPFWWKNNAKYNATVMCTVIGISNENNSSKYLYDENTITKTKAISPYLIPGENIIVKKISKIPISNFPKILFGNMARDNGHLILSEEEKNDLLQNQPESKRFIRKLVGGKEFLSGQKRWCLWIPDDLLSDAKKISSINNRLDLVSKFRSKSRNPTTKRFSKFSNKFVEIRHQEKQCLVIPITTSGNRKYIPMSFSEPDHIITNSMNMIYDAPLYLFSILQSKMHMLWVFTVSGYLGPSIRYSAELSYNTFPFPQISEKLKKKLEQKAVEVLFDEREKYSEKALDELYAPKNIPQSLLNKHQEIDDIVDNCYQDKEFKNDYERLNLLFKMYDNMSNNKTLF